MNSAASMTLAAVSLGFNFVILTGVCLAVSPTSAAPMPIAPVSEELDFDSVSYVARTKMCTWHAGDAEHMRCRYAPERIYADQWLCQSVERSVMADLAAEMAKGGVILATRTRCEERYNA